MENAYKVAIYMEYNAREICDVTFKALTKGQKVGNKTFEAGQPVFVIDTATASSMEQGTTSNYANGGRGYNRLIAWEGEKTMTFNVTDALMSPLGLAVLTGAGLAKDEDVKHVHVTVDVALNGSGEGKITFARLADELGIPATTAKIEVCNDSDLPAYATVLDANGAVVDWVDTLTLSGNNSTTIDDVIDVTSGTGNELKVTAASAANKTVKVDFYVRMTTGAAEITIAPDNFGGFFYVEADTLYRNQNGKDMAATLTFPKVKIQSGFTLSMSPNGDPSELMRLAA